MEIVSKRQDIKTKTCDLERVGNRECLKTLEILKHMVNGELWHGYINSCCKIWWQIGSMCSKTIPKDSYWSWRKMNHEIFVSLSLSEPLQKVFLAYIFILSHWIIYSVHTSPYVPSMLQKQWKCYYSSKKKWMEEVEDEVGKMGWERTL